jgi:twitching motility two-component system response regulator PilG
MSGTSFGRKQVVSDKNPAGYINGIAVCSFIQVLELEKKTCTLLVSSDGMNACLYLDKGVVLNAETGKLSGEEAAIQILGWENAQIKMIDDCAKKKRDIRSSLTRLILDAFIRKDELKHADHAADELVQAIYLIEGSHYKKGRTLLAAYLKSNPHSSKAWLWFSRCLGRKNMISAALHNCARLTPKSLQVREELSKLDKARQHVKDSRVGRCPFCWAPLDRSARECYYCLSKLSIAAALKNNTLGKVNSKYLIDAVTRYTDVIAREDNMRAVYYLILANCNLDKVDEAMDLLNEVSRTNPDNKFLSDLLNLVINHVATRLNKYERAKSVKIENTMPAGTAAETTNKNKILVVDDSPTTRKVVVLTLKQKGYVLVEAKDGLEALSKINDERPDLVLLDVILPKMDGYRILSIVRKTPGLKDTPVILLTSKDGLVDKVKGRLAGSTAYLTKPFEPNDLIETVRKYTR